MNMWSYDDLLKVVSLSRLFASVNSVPPNTAHMSVDRFSIDLDNGLSPIRAPSRYLYQWCDIVNWTLRNKVMKFK